jgi:hypothetical protein
MVLLGVILPINDLTVSVGDWSFGFTDWASGETIAYFGPWHWHCPVSAIVALGLIAILLVLCVLFICRFSNRRRGVDKVGG